MPELPEVETIVSDLNKKIKNATITNFWSDFSSAIKGVTLAKFKQAIKNKKILLAQRVGKNIFLHLSGGKTLHIHLRMTGHLLFKNNLSKKNNKNFQDKVNQYIHHIWYLSENKTLEFSDLRKFATIHLLETITLKKYLAEKKIGVDAMSAEFTLAKFTKLLIEKPQMLIGILLLDQSIISGIGNIYRSEILFSAGVLPERKVLSLTKVEQKKIFQATRKILQLAIKLRGTSDSDYRDTSGASGNFQKMLQVYRRDKTACPNCQKIILRKKLAQRSIFYCVNCQK